MAVRRRPDNEPHVGCTFQVDFYGYDEGDLEAQVTFEAQAPTLRPDGAGQVLLTDSVFIGEDDNAGGGVEAEGTLWKGFDVRLETNSSEGKWSEILASKGLSYLGSTLSTTLPIFWPVSTYLYASTI